MSRERVERAGLRYPSGDPDDFDNASRRLARVSVGLQTVPGRVDRLARLGEAWVGGAAERFRAGAARSASSISDVSGALRLASLAAERVGEALRRQQRAAQRLAEEVNEAEEEYRRAEREAERAEQAAEQARDRAVRAALTVAEGFSLVERARAAREAEVAGQAAMRARERATRARERYQETKRKAERELRRLEEETERADDGARHTLGEVTRTLSTVADPADDRDCPIDTPVFKTGAGALPFLTHGRRIARDALRNPFGPPAGAARSKAYDALAGGLRETFPGTCIGPEPPTPPKDPPSPRREPARPTDEPNWFERRLEDVGDLPGKAREAIGDAAGAAEDGFYAYGRWARERNEEVRSLIRDGLPKPTDEPSGPGRPPPIRLPLVVP